MKRSKPLMQLSREHHAALVLAKRAQRLAKGRPEDAQTFMSQLAAVFASELEPHFQVEETALLPALQDADEIGIVRDMIKRTLADHAALRELSRRIADDDFASLAPFGDVLDAHVRFEERELFNLAESVLTPEALVGVEAADVQRNCQCPAGIAS